jgi:hypothetical protein
LAAAAKSLIVAPTLDGPSESFGALKKNGIARFGEYRAAKLCSAGPVTRRNVTRLPEILEWTCTKAPRDAGLSPDVTAGKSGSNDDGGPRRAEWVKPHSVGATLAELERVGLGQASPSSGEINGGMIEVQSPIDTDAASQLATVIV